MWNIALLSLCLLNAVDSLDPGTAQLSIIWSYIHPQSTLENGRRCRFPFGRGCQARFQLCLWKGIKSLSAPCDAQITTRVYKGITELTESTAIRIQQPLPSVYSFRLTATANVLLAGTVTIGSFEAHRFALKPDGISRDVPLTRLERNPKNSGLRMSAKMSLNCGTNFYGEHCETFCMTDNSTEKCHADGRRTCHHGFRGRKCEWKDWCILEPCGTHATCLIKPDGSGRICLCNGANAKDCTSIFNPCASNPCENGGICSTDGARSSDFTCECIAPWTGRLCTQRLSACLAGTSNGTGSEQGDAQEPLCLNDGICVDDESTGGFICHCQPEWTGSQCEKPRPLRLVSTALFMGLCAVIASFLIFLITLGTALGILWRKRARKRKPCWSMARPLPKVPSDNYIYMKKIKDKTGTYEAVDECAKPSPTETDLPLLSDDSGMDTSYQSLEGPENPQRTQINSIRRSRSESKATLYRTAPALRRHPEQGISSLGLIANTSVYKKYCEYV